MLSFKINIKKSTNSDNMNMAGGRKLQIFSQQFRNLANVTFNNVHNTLIFNFVHFVWRQVRKYAKSYIKKHSPFTSKICNYVAWQKDCAISLFVIISLLTFKVLYSILKICSPSYFSFMKNRINWWNLIMNLKNWCNVYQILKYRTFCLLLTINYIRKIFCTVISFRAKITFKELSSPWDQKQFGEFLMFCGQSTIYAHFLHMRNYDMKHVKYLRKIYVGVKRSIIQCTTCVWFTTYWVIAIHWH